MPCCTLGQREDIETITKAMLPGDQGGEGLTVRAVAERFGCTKFAVETHWGCLKKLGHTPAPKRPPTRPERKPESERRPKAPEPDQTPDSEPDTGHRTEAPEPNSRTDKTGHGESGARGPGEQASWRERIWFIADLIAGNEYDGRETVKLLSQQFKVSREQILADVRVASMLVSEDRGTIETRREVSLAKLQTIRERALEKDRIIPCPHCERAVNVACPDYKAAVAAQRHMDEISGVLVKQGLNINIHNPAYDAVWAIVTSVLSTEERGVMKFPGALEEIEGRVQRYLAARRGELRVTEHPLLAAAS